MADEGGGTNLFQDMFKNFPIFTSIMIAVMIYVIWLSTGGVERGEQRRANGDTSLFVEVSGVPDSFDNQELFGVGAGPALESEE